MQILTICLLNGLIDRQYDQIPLSFSLKTNHGWEHPSINQKPLITSPPTIIITNQPMMQTFRYITTAAASSQSVIR